MNKLGGGSFVLSGIFLLILGILIRSDFLESLLDFLGFVAIVIGIIVVVIGLIQVFTGGSKSSSSDF